MTLWDAYAARREAALAGETAAAPLAAVAAPLPAAEAIAPRAWLYGTRLIRRFVSVLVAPGGVGKSALALGQAVAVATGRPILGEHVHHAVPAWVLNLEDPAEETHRRLAALMRHHGIPREALADTLYLHAGRDRRVTMGEWDAGGATVRHPDREAVVQAARARGIGLLVVDPFVKSHRLDENSNAQIDAAATAWSEVAEATDAAVLLVHHVRKGAAPADVEAARGAKALTDAARAAS
ncbi:MAG: AAA family ATPase, partial [Acetobacteraceae bacterium]|nr:AAA family ATPase [Acetobacteraceae bacterium]